MFDSQPVKRGTSELAQVPDPADQSLRGLVLVIGGVGSLDWCGIALQHLLKNKQPPYEVQSVYWGLGFGRWHADLTNVDNRNFHARAIAQRIRMFKESHARCPIFVVAKSGGSGVAVEALESVSEKAVERVVLLAPALSPNYDLTAALRAVRGEIVVFWSPLDVIVLGAGTRLFGTIDRVKTSSAGLVGFRVPPVDDARDRHYDRLRQVRWHPRMAASGNFGGHMGPDSPFFLRKYVVPLLTIAEPPPL
jgi:hypothetical protein